MQGSRPETHSHPFVSTVEELRGRNRVRHTFSVSLSKVLGIKRQSVHSSAECHLVVIAILRRLFSFDLNESESGCEGRQCLSNVAVRQHYCICPVGLRGDALVRASTDAYNFALPYHN